MKNLLLEENYTSKNLWNKINLLKEQQLVGISNGLDWTVENIPSAVLVGGTAVVHYITGARDLTPDLDFLVNDINSLRTKLSYDDIKYSELNPGYGEPIGITVDDFNTDYLDPEKVNPRLNELILRTPSKATIGGHFVNIINPELLAIMKFELGRDKDVNDGIKLLTSGKVNRNKYVTYLKELKSTLSDYESMLNYKNFIP